MDGINDPRRDLLRLAGAAAAVGISACVPAGQAMPTPDGEDRLTGDDMVGKKLRVVNPGDFVTQEHDIERVTINLDEDGKIIGVRLG